MRVLWMLSGLAMGGAERNVVSLLPYLLDGGGEIFLCTLNKRRDGPLAEALTRTNIKRFDLGAARMIDLAAWHRFTGLIRDLKVEILHAADQDSIVYAALAHRFLHVPAVMTRHVLVEPSSTRKEAARAKLVLWAARYGMDRIVAVSEAVRRALAQQSHLPLSKIETIYNGIDLDRFPARSPREEIRQELGWDPEYPIGVVISVMRPGKGFEVLFKALPQILAAIPGFQLKLVGDGPLAASLQDMAAPFGSAVEFMGQRMDIPELLGASDLLIQASWSEALPTVLIEAGAAGVPVVATDVGGSTEIVREGESGFIVAPGDAIALADRTIEILRSPELARRMGNYAGEYVRRTFSLPAQAAKTLALYRKVLAGSHEDPL